MSFIKKNKSLLLSLKYKLNTTLGIDIISFPSSEFAKKIKLIQHNTIEVVLDVGANIGQYALQLRMSGYKGIIYSFEPMQNEFSKLKKLAANDPKWEVFNYGLGESNKESEIHVAENSVSSSFLESSDEMNAIEPKVIASSSIKVKVKTLDWVYDDLKLENKRIFLKIDAQGYEKFILEGADNSLPKMVLVQLEMPFIKTYENSSDFYELLAIMQAKGFELVGIDSGYYNSKTGAQVEVDGMFLNSSMQK